MKRAFLALTALLLALTLIVSCDTGTGNSGKDSDGKDDTPKTTGPRPLSITSPSVDTPINAPSFTVTGSWTGDDPASVLVFFPESVAVKATLDAGAKTWTATVEVSDILTKGTKYLSASSYDSSRKLIGSAMLPVTFSYTTSNARESYTVTMKVDKGSQTITDGYLYAYLRESPSNSALYMSSPVKITSATSWPVTVKIEGVMETGLIDAIYHHSTTVYYGGARVFPTIDASDPWTHESSAFGMANNGSIEVNNADATYERTITLGGPTENASADYVYISSPTNMSPIGERTFTVTGGWSGETPASVIVNINGTEYYDAILDTASKTWIADATLPGSYEDQDSFQVNAESYNAANESINDVNFHHWYEIDTYSVSGTVTAPVACEPPYDGNVHAILYAKGNRDKEIEEVSISMFGGSGFPVSYSFESVPDGEYDIVFEIRDGSYGLWFTGETSFTVSGADVTVSAVTLDPKCSILIGYPGSATTISESSFTVTGSWSGVRPDSITVRFSTADAVTATIEPVSDSWSAYIEPSVLEETGNKTILAKAFISGAEMSEQSVTFTYEKAE